MASTLPETQKRTYTYPEVLQTFFPNSVLNRLHERLVETLGITYDFQHRFSPSKEKPLTGFIEVAKMGFHRIKNIRETVILHYQMEGFEMTSQPEQSLMTFQRGEEFLTVSLTESSASFSVHVTETMSILR